MKRKLFMLATAMMILVFVFATSTMVGANMITNGGFETGNVFGDPPFGWTTVGTTKNSLYVAPFNPHSGILHVTTGYSYDWQYIQQTIITTPGQSYTFDFWLSSGEADYSDHGFVALWNGAEKTNLVNPPYAEWVYTHYSYEVLATGDLTTIEFGFYNTEGFFDLDDVSVNQVTATPEPFTLLLLGTGLVGLAGLRRFKK